MSGVEFTVGDILAVAADAIVRDATGGPAFLRAAGPAARDACAAIGRWPSGTAVITCAGRLRARYAIHALPPAAVRRPAEARRLFRVYACALELGRQRGLRSIAFPPLGVSAADAASRTLCAKIALAAVREHRARPTPLPGAMPSGPAAPERIIFVFAGHVERDAFAVEAARVDRRADPSQKN
jgi:O-acetyl-ADP-ribose deacetylase (regulator of RNase III)